MNAITTKLKGIGEKIGNFFRKITTKLMKNVSGKIVSDIRASVNADIKLAAQQQDSAIPYYCGEKIRIVFIFQTASLWPSWESFYESCVNDPSFSVTFALLNDDDPDPEAPVSEDELFLQSKGIPYAYFSNELMARTRPHVVVLQTPFDWNRPRYARSDVLKKYGTRLAYITYGIEIADTSHAHKDNYTTAVKNCWRVYTFSDRMRADYAIFCNNGVAVRACGHPIFDALYCREKFSLPEEVRSGALGRKTILWYLQFPRLDLLTEYNEFVKTVSASEDFFFIAQIHPKFLDCKEELQDQVNALVEELENLPNVYIDRDADYRSCLMLSDYIITDRGAIMVEGAAAGVPILYMSSADFHEPMTEAVRPLVESYVQGHTAEDMTSFVEDCRNGLDLQKDAREKAFHECIPYFDGKCGERIKEDIATSLMSPEQIQLMELQKLVKGYSQADTGEEKSSLKALDDSVRFLNNAGSVEKMTPEEIDRLDGKLDLLEMKIREFREEIQTLRNENFEGEVHCQLAGVRDHNQ